MNFVRNEGNCIAQILKIEEFDESIVFKDSNAKLLVSKYLEPNHICQPELFDNLFEANVSLVINEKLSLVASRQIIEFLNKYADMTPTEKHRIRTYGKFAVHLSLSDIMYLWEGTSTKIHTTDISVERSNLGMIVNIDKLNRFNIFNTGSRKVSGLEMLALTVSTKGSITQSHSDDSDGINHGLIGKKVWFAWNTDEGMEHGLEDSQRINSESVPKFDLNIFLSLKSSRWFVVDAGTTVYLPGIMAHRVITIEDYIGLSSFNLSFPSLLNTLTKWTKIEPLFIRRSGKEEGEKILSEIIKTTQDLSNQLIEAPEKEREKWGFNYFLQSKKQLLKNVCIDDFIDLFPSSSQSNLKTLLKA